MARLLREGSRQESCKAGVDVGVVSAAGRALEDSDESIVEAGLAVLVEITGCEFGLKFVAADAAVL